MINWIITVLSFSLLLGNAIPDAAPPCHVVTQVRVEWTEDGIDFSRIYTEHEKMNKLLLYLRSLKPVPIHDPPTDAENPLYSVHLIMSDGSSKVFQQLGLFYFHENAAQWQAVDPETAIRLPLILAAIPGDIE